MKIGYGWTKNTENGDTYISISLDEVIGVIFPPLKPLLRDCFITLWHIKKEDRKNENSPSWAIDLKIKKEKEEKTTEEIPM